MNNSFLGEEVWLLDSAGPPRRRRTYSGSCQGPLDFLSSFSIILLLSGLLEYGLWSLLGGPVYDSLPIKKQLQRKGRNQLEKLEYPSGGGSDQ